MRPSDEDEIVEFLQSDLDRMVKQGFVECKFCKAKFFGNTLGEMLDQIGQHAEAGEGLCPINPGPSLP